MTDFVAIDWETANDHRCSPCAIGITTVSGGVVVDRWSTVIRPPDGYDEVDDFNYEIHGISQAEVDAAPPFASVWPEIRDRIARKTIVAHNAAFDVGVLRDTLDVIGEPWPDLDYVCTVVLARHLLDLESNRLPYVADALGVTLDQHHDAMADADAAAGILLRLMQDHDADDVDALIEAAGCRIGTIRGTKWKGCIKLPPPGGWPSRDLVAGDVNEDADPENPLFGMNVCFTGTLRGMTRQEAWDRLTEAGGTPSKGVTKKVDMLVVGAQEVRGLRPGVMRSSKHIKAAQYGAEIMGEDDFYAMIDHTPAPPKPKPSRERVQRVYTVEIDVDEIVADLLEQ